MVESITTLITALNTLTPLALVGGMAIVAGASLVIVYNVVAKKGKVRLVSDNHLTHIGQDLAELKELKPLLGEIRDGVNKLVDRSR